MRRTGALSYLALSVCLATACSTDPDPTESHPDAADDASTRTDSTTPDTRDSSPAVDSSVDSSLDTLDSSDTTASDSRVDTGVDSDGTVDSIVADDSSGDTKDAADVAEAEAPKVGTYIDAVRGRDDTGDGTSANPFLTLKKAASVATVGQTIYAFPGTYPLDIAAVTIADGVGIEALTYGTVTFADSSTIYYSFGITFKGSGFVHGVAMERAYINVSAGTVTLDGVRAAGVLDPGAAGQSAINVSGTGHVVITPGGLTNYIVPGLSSFADLRDASQLEVHGGAFVDAGRNSFEAAALFGVAGTSKLVLDGVTIDNAKTGAVQFSDSASVTLQGGTLVRATAQESGVTRQSLNSNHGSPTLVVDNSTITGSAYSGITVNVGSATPTITLRNGAVVEKCASFGILTAGTLTLDNARISDNGNTGVDLESGTLITAGGTVVRNNRKGIELRFPAVYTLAMRNTQVIDNTSAGLSVVYKDGGSFDLGTAASPGGNTFKGNATNVTFNGSLTTGDLIVTAIGNNWDPTGNGADSTGHFPAKTTFVAPPSVSGPNVTLLQSGTATYHASLVATP
jgi:hypothetical protein